MANSTNVIHAAATLAKSTGKVFVRHPDGTQSVLKAGAQLNVGDVVVTSPGAHAEIQVAEGQLIKVGGAAGDALTIDKSILDTPADHHDVKADAATDFNKIIENLAKGDDIGDNLDPTAAGAAGAAGGDLMSGNVYVVVDPIVTTTTPSPFENVNSPSANTEPTMFSLLLAQANISLTASGIVDGIASDEDGVKYTASVDKISDVDLLIHLTVNGEPFDITIKAGTSSTDFSVLPKGEFVHGASETVVMLGATGGSYSSYSGSATSTFNFEDDHITVSIDPSKTSGVTSGIGSDEGGVTYTLSVDKGDQAPTDDVYVKVSVFDADAETNQTTYQFVKVVDGGTFTVATTEGQHGDHLTVTLMNAFYTDSTGNTLLTGDVTGDLSVGANPLVEGSVTTTSFQVEDDHITVSIDPSKTSGVTSGIGSDEGGVTYTLSVDKGDQAPTDDVYVKVSVFDADAETNQTTYQFVKVVDGGTFTVATTEGQHGDHLTVTILPGFYSNNTGTPLTGDLTNDLSVAANADAGTVTTTSFQVEDDHINIKLTQHPSLAEESKQADDELSKAEKHLHDAEDDDARKVAEKEVEAANQHKIDVDGSKEHAKEGAGREVENAQKDAENARNEVDVAEHHKSEAEGRKSEAEHHKSEAEGRKSEAEHHKSEAESRKSEANKELANAEKHLHEAKTRSEKNDAQSEVGKAKQDQIKADADISKAQKDVDNARHEVERAQQDADNAQKDSDKARKEIDVAEQHKTEAEGRKAEAEHAIGETVNDQVTATIHVDLGPNIDASLYVKVDVFDGSVEGNPSVKTAYIALTDLNKSGDGDYTFSYNTQVEGHSYTVSIADKLYTHQGETYRQQDSTDDLAISRVIEIAAHDVLVVNDEALPALNGLDIITNYHAGDLIDFAGIPSVAMHDDGVYNTHLKIDGSTYIDIQSHAIVNGVVTFYSGENQTSLLSLNSDAKIASALDYLTHHDIGNQGAAVVFEDASNNSYVYSQTTSNNGAADSYSFVKLEGFNAFNGVSSSPTNVDVHTVHIE